MQNRVLFAAITLCSLVAGAEPRWGLKWKSGAGCIEAADLSRAVEQKLGRSVFSGDADFKIDGAADGGPGAWKVNLTLISRAASSWTSGSSPAPNSPAGPSMTSSPRTSR